MTLTLKGHVIVPKIVLINLNVLDIPEDFWRIWGKKFFRPRDLFVPNTLFVILDVLDIPGEFGGKNFFPLKNGPDLELFSEKNFSS